MAHRAIQKVLEGVYMIVSAVVYEYRAWRLFHKYDISGPRFTQLCQSHGDEWVAYQRVKEQHRARKAYQTHKALEVLVYVVLTALWLL